MKLRDITWVVLGALALVALVGCAHAPPSDAFDHAVAEAGIGTAIEFVVDEIPVDAGARSSGAELTLEEAVQRTLLGDPAIQAAIARTRVALAEAKQARLLPNPVVSVAVRFPEGDGESIIEAGLAADLVSLLTTSRRVNAADARLRAASCESLVAVLDALAEVQTGYANVQALDTKSVTLDERRRLVGRMLELTRARVEAGESGRLDVIVLDSERAALEVEIAQARLERREARLALARMIGEPSGAAEWKLSAWSAPGRVWSDEAGWIRAALERRPEVQARRWELAALGDELAVRGWGALEGAEVGVDSEREEAWSVGPSVSLPIPLLDWGQERKAKVAAQRVEGRHELTKTSRKIVEEVRRALEALRGSQAALELARGQLIPLADERREQAEASYKNGFADITAVLLAEQEAQAARAKLIELQEDVSAAHFRLQRAAGGPGVRPTTAPTTSELP